MASLRTLARRPTIALAVLAAFVTSFFVARADAQVDRSKLGPTLLAPSAATASSAAPAPSAPATPPAPNEGARSEVEVRTESGDWVRGELVELAVNDHIVIRLPSGEERRYPWAAVHGFRTAVPPGAPSASNAASEPPPVPPPDPRDAEVSGFDPNGNPLGDVPSVEVEIEGAYPGLRLQLVTGYTPVGTYTSPAPVYYGGSRGYGGYGAGYTRTVFQTDFMTLCRAPCRVRLAVGRTYHMHVGTDDETNTHLPSSSSRVRITADTRALTIDYRNRSRTRHRAWWAVGVMPVLGALLTGLATVMPPGPVFGGADYGHNGRNNGVFWMGVGLMCTPSVSYAVPLLLRDRSRVRAHRSAR